MLHSKIMPLSVRRLQTFGSMQCVPEVSELVLMHVDRVTNEKIMQTQSSGGPTKMERLQNAEIRKNNLRGCTIYKASYLDAKQSHANWGCIAQNYCCTTQIAAVVESKVDLCYVQNASFGLRCRSADSREHKIRLTAVQTSLTREMVRY